MSITFDDAIATRRHNRSSLATITLEANLV